MVPLGWGSARPLPLVRLLLRVEGAGGALMVGLRRPLGAVPLLILMCFRPPEQAALRGLPTGRLVRLCSGPPAHMCSPNSGSRGWSAGWARCSCRTAPPGPRPPRPAPRCAAGAATRRGSSTARTPACASRSSSASSEVGRPPALRVVRAPGLHCPEQSCRPAAPPPPRLPAPGWTPQPSVGLWWGTVPLVASPPPWPHSPARAQLSSAPAVCPAGQLPSDLWAREG